MFSCKYLTVSIFIYSIYILIFSCNYTHEKREHETETHTHRHTGVEGGRKGGRERERKREREREEERENFISFREKFSVYPSSIEACLWGEESV